MATIYGNTIVSAWRSVLVYSITETPTTYTINVTNAGAHCVNNTYSIDGTGDSGCNFKETLTGIESSPVTYTTNFRNSGFYGTSIYTETMSLNCPFTKTIVKTTSTQSVTVSFACNITAFYRTNRSSGSGKSYGSYTSTASKIFTVPALAKPSIAMDLQRAENDNTQVNVVATVNSFVDDVISGITLIADGVTQSPTWNPVLPKTMTSSTQTFETTLTIQDENTIPFSISCQGLGGSSTTITKNLTGAFYTIDVKGGGREIAFGAPATDDLTDFPNGLFKCGMAQRNAVEEITHTVTTATGTTISSSCYRVGNLVLLHMVFRNTSAVAAGSNVYQATLSSAVPTPIAEVTGATYFSNFSLPYLFNTDKRIRVRNTGDAAITVDSSSSVQIGLIYMTND